MQANTILDYDVLAANRPYTLHLMVRVQAGAAPGDAQRRPLNLSLVIDRSGSMAGRKIDYTRQAAQVLVQNLGARDTLSIVLYNDTVETLLMPEKVQRKDIINERIASVKVGGTTNLSGGWLEGCKLVGDNIVGECINRVILMTDGLANRGVTDSDHLVALAEQKLGEGVSTTTMGLGKDFNEDLLMAMADAGGGAFYFIESPEVAPDIFRDELEGLLNVVGQNLTVRVAPGAHVGGLRQMNAYPLESDGVHTTYRMGDVFGDEVKALLLEVTVNGIPEIGEHDLATLHFAYDALGENGVTRQSWEMPVRVNVVTALDNQLPNPDVTQSVLLLQAAEARREAVKVADRGQVSAASQILRTVADAIDRAQLDDGRLAEEQRALLAQADEIELGYDEYVRKSMSTQAFYTMNNRHEDTQMLRGRESERKSKGDALPAPSIQVERGEGVPPTQVTWKDKTFALDGSLIRIGRSRHNEVVIKASGVSRFHCQIRREGETLYLEDLGSTNGTVVDGKAIEGAYALSVGDVVYLCDEELRFHD